MLGKEKVNLNSLLAADTTPTITKIPAKAAKIMFNAIVLTSYFDF